MEKEYGYIYLITNNINNKKYVGATKEKPSRRWSKHKYHHNNRKYVEYANEMYKEMIEFGIENFSFNVIDTAKDSDELREKEIHYIDELNTIKDGYNKTKGGDNIEGFGIDKKEVIRLSMTGEKLEEYESVRRARTWVKETLGSRGDHVVTSLESNGQRMAYGYRWIYKKADNV